MAIASPQPSPRGPSIGRKCWGAPSVGLGIGERMGSWGLPWGVPEKSSNMAGKSWKIHYGTVFIDDFPSYKSHSSSIFDGEFPVSHDWLPEGNSPKSKAWFQESIFLTKRNHWPNWPNFGGINVSNHAMIRSMWDPSQDFEPPFEPENTK